MQRENFYSHVQAQMHDWGMWARRPQFWAKLRGSGMYALIPIQGGSWMPEKERQLDPLSSAIHASVMAMDDQRAGVLYAYYVRGVSFDNKPHVFRQFGISRTKFYELLKDSSVMAYNAGKALDSRRRACLNTPAEVSPRFDD